MDEIDVGFGLVALAAVVGNDPHAVAEARDAQLRVQDDRAFRHLEMHRRVKADLRLAAVRHIVHIACIERNNLIARDIASVRAEDFDIQRHALFPSFLSVQRVFRCFDIALFDQADIGQQPAPVVEFIAARIRAAPAVVAGIILMDVPMRAPLL